MSTRKKFILILLASLALMAGGVSAAAYITGQKAADEEFLRIAASQLDRVDDSIHAHFRIGEQAARTLASWPETRSAAARTGSDAVAMEILRERAAVLRKAMPGVEAVFCAFANGAYIAEPPESIAAESDPRALPWYSDTAWGRAGNTVSDIHISETSRGLVATLATKIKGASGETLGVAAIDFSLAALTDTLRDVRFGASGRLVLLDAKNRVLLDPSAQENLLRDASETGDAALAHIAGQAGGVSNFARDGKEYVVFVRALGEMRWKAAFLLEKNEALSVGRAVSLPLVATALVLLVFLGGCGALLTAFAVRPLLAVIRQSGALADGNLDALQSVPGRGPDVAALHGNLGRLTGRIMLLGKAEKEKAAAVDARARDLWEAAAREGAADKAALAAYAETVRAAAGKLAPVAGELADGLASLAQNREKNAAESGTLLIAAETAREQAQTLADATATLAGQGAETEKTSGEVLRLAQSGSVLMQDLARSLEGTANQVASLITALDPLKTATSEITALSDAVRDIAEAVNLLGLNVSIEAASAGEAGKNFAPFADDMRALAEKAMGLASAMEEKTAALDQGHTAHFLAVNKSAATVSRAVSGLGKARELAAQTAAAATAAAEQIRVLSTALEGMKETAATSPASADALLRDARGVNDALVFMRNALASLSALGNQLTALADENLAAVDNDAERKKS